MNGIHEQSVVVGVHGTAASSAALGFGLREAARRGSVLEVITAWALARPAGTPKQTGTEALDCTARDDARRLAQQLQDEAVAQTFRANPDARPVVSRQVIEGDAGAVLLKSAARAAYLVVGSSGGPSIKLLGSVGAYCVGNASGPVVVVPLPASVVY